MPWWYSSVAHLKKKDRISRTPRWEKTSSTVLGGIFTYLVPMFWGIFTVYCIACFYDVSSDVSNVQTKLFPKQSSTFDLPQLQCVAPGGCFISPMLQSTPNQIRQYAEETKTTCKYNSIPTIKGQKSRPPNRKLSQISQNIRPGRQCFYVKCGDTLKPQHRLFYQTNDINDGFVATWENSSIGFFYNTPDLSPNNGSIKQTAIELPSGIILMQVLRKVHSYYGTEAIQYIPTVAGYLDNSLLVLKKNINVCCLQQSSIYVSASTTSVNCSSKSIQHALIRPFSTYTEEATQKRFRIMDIMGLSGGALILFAALSKLWVHFVNHIMSLINLRRSTKDFKAKTKGEANDMAVLDRPIAREIEIEVVREINDPSI